MRPARPRPAQNERHPNPRLQGANVAADHGMIEVQELRSAPYAAARAPDGIERPQGGEWWNGPRGCKLTERNKPDGVFRRLHVDLLHVPHPV